MFIPGISKNVRFCKKREGQIISLKHGMSATFECSPKINNKKKKDFVCITFASVAFPV